MYKNKNNFIVTVLFKKNYDDLLNKKVRILQKILKNNSIKVKKLSKN